MKYFAYIALLVFSLIFVFDSLLISQDEQVRSGSIIFLEMKCNKCHTINSQAIECSETTKNSINDLSTVGDSLEIENFKDYLVKKVKLNNKKHPIAFKGKKNDLDILCNWLHNLSSVVY